MVYDRDQLQAAVTTVMSIARDNLLKDGSVQPCGLVFTTNGLAKVVEFRFRSLRQRRRIQDGFRHEVIKRGGIAVIIVMETWLALAPDLPTDLTKSLEQFSGRKEAIVVEGVSLSARAIMIQPFRRNGALIVLENPIISDSDFTWTSEWTDGLWDHRREGKA